MLLLQPRALKDDVMHICIFTTATRTNQTQNISAVRPNFVDSISDRCFVLVHTEAKIDENKQKLLYKETKTKAMNKMKGHAIDNKNTSKHLTKSLHPRLFGGGFEVFKAFEDDGGEGKGEREGGRRRRRERRGGGLKGGSFQGFDG